MTTSTSIIMARCSSYDNFYQYYNGPMSFPAEIFEVGSQTVEMFVVHSEHFPCVIVVDIGILHVLVKERHSW